MQKLLIAVLLLSLTFYPRNSLGDQVTAINKGDPAPYAGVLMDQEKANKVKIAIEERDLYEQIVNSQGKSIELLKQNNVYAENKVNLLLEQNDKLAERLQSAQSLNSLERIGLVVLGVAMTVGAGLAIRSIAK